MKKLFLILASLLVISACTQKAIYNVENGLVPTQTSGELPAIETVEKAIVRGSRIKGWVPRKVSDGLIEASIMVRSHKAVVDVAFDETTYSIRYKSSENLDFKDGNIHRNYNKWVNNLDRSIRTELSRAILTY